MDILKKLALLIGLFSLTACQTITHKVVENEHSYNENITFNTSKIFESQTIGEGRGNWRSSPRYKFVTLYVNVKNNSHNEQKIDFDDFYLHDESKRKKYRSKFTFYNLSALGPNVRSPFQEIIPANSRITRKLVYPFPQEVSPNRLIVKDKVIKIEW